MKIIGEEKNKYENVYSNMKIVIVLLEPLLFLKEEWQIELHLV